MLLAITAFIVVVAPFFAISACAWQTDKCDTSSKNPVACGTVRYNFTRSTSLGIAAQSSDAMVLIQSRASERRVVAAFSADPNRTFSVNHATCREACDSDGCECHPCSHGLSYSCDECCCFCPSKPTCPSTTGHTNNYWCERQAVRTGGSISSTLASVMRIALLMRGGIYRRVKRSGHTKSLNEDCSRAPNATLSQEKATQSLVENVVQVFESFGITVDIFVTASTCDRVDEIVQMLGEHRVRNVTTFDTNSQRDSIRYALDVFKEATGGAIASKYDLFVLTRHDIIFYDHLRPAFSSLDTGKFNFLSMCYEEMKVSLGSFFDQCTIDQFYTMPSRYFAAFDTVIGASNSCCFQPETVNRFGGLCMDSGHFCLPALQNVSMPRPFLEIDDAGFGFMFDDPGWGLCEE